MPSYYVKRIFRFFILGGPDNWSQLTTGKTSEQILELLLTEFKARGPQGPEEFEGKGLGEDVPKYVMLCLKYSQVEKFIYKIALKFCFQLKKRLPSFAKNIRSAACINQKNYVEKL